MRKAKLRGANLTGAYLMKAVAYAADFEGANLSDALMDRAVLVNANFKEIFARLFQGGKASLTLVDEANPLDSVIEISANPFGKSLQSLALMSGGEKAMTAIALMFAVFKVRPSPFCLLDEVDAPLDEANVVRFQEMLKEMAVNT